MVLFQYLKSLKYMRNKEYFRKNRNKRLAPANYLIVCEGKQTEPNYFNCLKKKINEKYGSKIDVLVPNIEVKGTGKNTADLVRYTSKFVNYSNKEYGKVWVVFDKDDYDDVQFDDAITNCDYNVAWSNPNFELWLLLHFRKVNNYISKSNIFEYLSKEFQKNGLGIYEKNDDKLYEKVAKNDGITRAIENSKSLEVLNNGRKPSSSNPMTMVYKILIDLEDYL